MEVIRLCFGLVVGDVLLFMSRVGFKVFIF